MLTATASEDFGKNRRGGFRYVDKTPLLATLLDGEHESTFFLRPRRFGKTLTLSMIRYFIEDTGDEELNRQNRALFDGLKIMEMGDRYVSQMTSYPVINLTLQTVAGERFSEAWQALTGLIQGLYSEKAFLLESPALSVPDRRFFQRVLNDVDETGKKVTRADYIKSLQNLSLFLRKASGARTVVLIDEYDVPLEKAYRNGYYKSMVRVIGPMLQNVLKTNSVNLQFAVVTGCLRIAREGIYTGLNNPEINTVLSRGNNDCIGFTEEEVRALLAESGFEDRYQECAQWYDGYLFGLARIYNPWSVIKYIEDLRKDPASPPALHWAGTSENAIIREMAEYADFDTRQKAEKLMRGEGIQFALRDDIVYEDLYRDQDSIFNVMLATGYLTAVSCDAKTVQARIPNREVLQIFTDKSAQWFRDSVAHFNPGELYRAMEQGQTERMEEILNERFLPALSYYDSVEAFYHGALLSILQMNRTFLCASNRESGTGRFDIQCKRASRRDLAYILEVKVSNKKSNMLADAKRAVKQARVRRYTAEAEREGYRRVIVYGIAFCEKTCRVVSG